MLEEVCDAAVLGETQDNLDWGKLESDTHAWLDAVENIYHKHSTAMTTRLVKDVG